MFETGELAEELGVEQPAAAADADAPLSIENRL